jgi:hypothetical protein
MKVNLLINQGETFQTVFTVLDGDEAKDLTDYDASVQIRKHPSSNTYYEFTTTVDEENGRITLEMTAAQTANIPHGRYFYDCVITSSNNAPTLRPFEGTVTIMPGITR